jgi:hypothetical protein
MRSIIKTDVSISRSKMEDRGLYTIIVSGNFALQRVIDRGVRVLTKNHYGSDVANDPMS